MSKVMSNAQPLDGRAFREALGAFTTGVTVVTTRGEQGDVGLTANSFNSVSLDPPMVLWSLGKNASSLPAFRAASHFAVHILSENQQELSNRFATRGIDKFADTEVMRGPDDVPLLNDCAARFVCRTEYQYEGGDHIIFVGEVLDFSHWERSPLLFHGGKYGRISKNPSAESSERPTGTESPARQASTIGSTICHASSASSPLTERLRSPSRAAMSTWA